MKHPFTNLFTAPDVTDVLTERRLTLRNTILMFGTGIVLVCTLIGGYVLGTWFLAKTVALPTPSESLTTEVADPRSIASRLGALESVNVPDPAQVLERSRALGGESEPNAASVDTEAVDARLKALESN